MHLYMRFSDTLVNQKITLAHIFSMAVFCSMTNAIGQALKAARREMRMTQLELARHLGCAQSFIADIERGIKPLPRDQYNKLPDQIRRKVIAAAIDEHRAAIAELKALRRQ
jgi:predicted transcriptional regulator